MRRDDVPKTMTMSASDAERHLASRKHADTTKPAVGQPWQSRVKGDVVWIDHLSHDGNVVHYRPDGKHYALTEYMLEDRRCVVHIPERFLRMNGRPIESWREYALLLEEETLAR